MSMHLKDPRREIDTVYVQLCFFPGYQPGCLPMHFLLSKLGASINSPKVGLCHFLCSKETSIKCVLCLRLACIFVSFARSLFFHV